MELSFSANAGRVVHLVSAPSYGLDNPGHPTEHGGSGDTILLSAIFQMMKTILSAALTSTYYIRLDLGFRIIHIIIYDNTMLIPLPNTSTPDL